MSDKIGIIDETGDLGLGFDELNEKDQKEYDKYNEAMSRKYKESKKDSNNRQK